MYANDDIEINIEEHWALQEDFTDPNFLIPHHLRSPPKTPPIEVKPIEFETEEIDMEAKKASYDPKTKTYDPKIYDQVKKANQEEFWMKMMFNSDDEDDEDDPPKEKPDPKVITCGVCNITISGINITKCEKCINN